MREGNVGALAHIIKGGGSGGFGGGGGGGGGLMWPTRRVAPKRRSTKRHKTASPKRRKTTRRKSVKRLKRKKVGKKAGGGAKRINKKRKKSKKRFVLFKMSNLPIFGNPSFQQELEDSNQVDINPLGDVAHGPIEFNIVGNNDFIDLNATTLHVAAKITKADGTAYADKAEVAFINNTLHSLFSDVIVSINDTIVEGGEQTYSMNSKLDSNLMSSYRPISNLLYI